MELLERNASKSAGSDCLSAGSKGVTYAQVVEVDKVALRSLNTSFYVFALFGVQLAGAVVVPFNHKLMAPEVDCLLAHSEARIFLYDGALAPMADKLALSGKKSPDTPAAEMKHFDALLASASALRPVAEGDQALADILYISDTTDKPKDCPHTQQKVIIAMNMDHHDRLLMAMSIWDSSPLTNWFIGVIYVNAATVLLCEYHPLHFLQAVQEKNAPSTSARLFPIWLPWEVLPNLANFYLFSMRCWICGGWPTAGNVAKRLMAVHKNEKLTRTMARLNSAPPAPCCSPRSRSSAPAPSAAYRPAWPTSGRSRMTASRPAPARRARYGSRPRQHNNEELPQGQSHHPRTAFSEGWHSTGDMARK
jgi:feruloyl-CoA synthase